MPGVRARLRLPRALRAIVAVTDSFYKFFLSALACALSLHRQVDERPHSATVRVSAFDLKHLRRPPVGIATATRVSLGR